ncbi:MAG: hypothetical protein ACKKMR_02645 [Candidatus Nealsonbacteria bacterium]
MTDLADLLKVIKEKKESKEFKKLKKDVEKEQTAMVLELLVNYKIFERLGKEFDDAIEELDKERQKDTLDLAKIKAAKTKLKTAEKKYKEDKKKWLSEKELVRMKLKKRSHRRKLK